MTDTQPWPYPQDTALDRARRIAWSYREALRTHDPAMCELLDNRARRFGETWVVPVETDAQPEKFYSAVEIAKILHIQADRVRQWGSRKQVPTIHGDGVTLYKLADCIERLAQARRSSAPTGQDRV